MSTTFAALRLPRCIHVPLGAIVVLFATAACGQSDEPADPVDAGGTDAALLDAVSDSGSDSGSTTQTDTKEDTADADVITPLDCPDPGHYDPPQFPYSCTGLNTYTYYKPIWTNICSDDCCWSEPGIAYVAKFCPAGTVCTVPTSQQSEPCQPADCTTDADCQEDERCTFAVPSCGTAGVGTCSPATCPADLSTQVSGQFCDCNGKTWSNACKAWEAGATAVHSGPCCDPKKFTIPPENWPGFTQLEICGVPSTWTASGQVSVPPGWSLATTSDRCDGVAYVTDLALAATGTALDPGGYLALCSLVADPGVHGAGGLGGSACQGVPPAAKPACSQGCTAPCGCKVQGTAKPDVCHVKDGKYGILQQNGWCEEVVPCQAGQTCTQKSGAPVCIDPEP